MVKLLDRAAEQEVVQALRQAETQTSGEIRVHVKRGATKDAILEARRVFQKLGMHRTGARSGVLIFISWKSRSFAIVGDEGIHRVTGDVFWNTTRDSMQAEFANGDLVRGILKGILEAGEQLKRHFPRAADNKNELPDTVTEGD